MRTILNSFIFVLVIIGFVGAEVPQLITYQGRLTDDTGDPVPDAQYSIFFTIYDDAEVVIWRENHASVTTSDGLFTVLLGAGDHSGYGALDESVFSDSTRWLGIKVGEDPEIVPRTRLVTVPFSFHSQRSDTAEISLGIEGADIVHSSNIINEPGIAFAFDNDDKILGAPDMMDLVTVTITTPGSGYIHVSGRCTVIFGGTIYSTGATFQIDETQGGTIQPDYEARVSMSQNYYTSEKRIPVCVDRVYYKEAGTYTFRLEGRQLHEVFEDGFAYTLGNHINAVYYPSGY